ncbi:unnamed protein product [Schistosoma rodhaini]|uniref:Uncharacterized protein n=1 Tax=Schistosoma rodhaini TaxID=6188 RepID=A0AA85GIF8_9TREM|nr:unnamed protein product [Schistosoma rodhaini]
MTFNLVDLKSFLISLKNAIETCSEYDIIPHIEQGDHKPLCVCDEAFGICNCTTTIIFGEYESNTSEPVSDDLLNYLLLVSPNTTTFWNFKRKALLNNKLSVNPELRFTQLILNKYPRSYETIFQRQWIIHRYNYLNDHEFLLSELKLCDKLADKYRCNYGLWQYRRFLLSHQQNPETYKIELDNLDVWLSKHPTDISGWSYLESVFDGLVGQSMVVALSPTPDDQKLQLENSIKIIQSYFEKVHDILELYPERECVWMFRRRLITFWIQLNQHQSSYNFNESIVKLLSPVEPLLPKTLDIITKLESSKIYFTGFSFNEFLNWLYTNNLCKEPSSLKWTDLLSWRYLFWLSEYLTSLLKNL